VSENEPPPRPVLSQAVRMPLYAVAVAVIGFMIWGLFAPLNRGVLAEGFVEASGRRTVLQHEDGGEVGRVFVVEGSRVKAGDTIMTLNTQTLTLSIAALDQQYWALLTERAVRLADAQGNAAVVWPKALAEQTDPQIVRARESALGARMARQAAETALISVLRAQIDQNRASIIGVEAEIAANTEETRSIRNEYDVLKKLFDQGLVPRARIYPLDRALAVAEGTKGRLASARQQLFAEGVALNRRIAEAGLKAREAAAIRLAEIDAALLPVDERLASERLKLARATIKAPIAGRILAQPAMTPGGVLRAGETVAEIVPDEGLVIRARIRPNDIERVSAGQKANVRLVGLNPQTTPRLIGKVSRVSPDALSDRQTGASYFEAIVTLDRNQKLPDAVVLSPGMPAQVTVDAGARSAFAYLSEPVRNAYEQAFRE